MSAAQLKVITAYNEAVAKGQLLDVSKLKADGTGSRKIPVPSRSTSTKRWIDGVAVASNNYAAYALAMQLLGAQFAPYAGQFLQKFGGVQIPKPPPTPKTPKTPKVPKSPAAPKPMVGPMPQISYLPGRSPAVSAFPAISPRGPVLNILPKQVLPLPAVPAFAAAAVALPMPPAAAAAAALPMPPAFAAAAVPLPMPHYSPPRAASLAPKLPSPPMAVLPQVPLSPSRMRASSRPASPSLRQLTPPAYVPEALEGSITYI